jgi:hypothetical protein
MARVACLECGVVDRNHNEFDHLGGIATPWGDMGCYGPDLRGVTDVREAAKLFIEWLRSDVETTVDENKILRNILTELLGK